MRGLGSCVDNYRWLQFLYQIQHTLAVADVELMMTKVWQGLHKPLLAPAGIPLRAEEDRPLVVVDTMDQKALFMEECSDLRADETGGPVMRMTFIFHTPQLKCR